jgi:hypothetical protein
LRSLGVSSESLRAISETLERVRSLEGVDRSPHQTDQTHDADADRTDHSATDTIT